MSKLRELLDLREGLQKLQSEVRAMEYQLGFSDTLHLGHYDGTNCEEWQCKLCGKKWLLPDRWPCSECHESTFV